MHIPIRKELGFSRQEHCSFQTWDVCLALKARAGVWELGIVPDTARLASALASDLAMLVVV